MDQKERAVIKRETRTAFAEIGNTVHNSEAFVPTFRKPQKLLAEEIVHLSRNLKTDGVHSQCNVSEKAADIEDISYSLQQLGIEDIAKKISHDPIFLGEYVKEYFQYLRKLEETYPLRENFLHGSVTPEMRAVLVDWLVEIQCTFSFLQETLFKATAVLDRYLQKVQFIEKKKLQLVAATAMHIASKYEEISAPDISYFVYICNSQYTKNDFFDMEIRILKSLNYFVGFPLAPHFLHRYKSTCRDDLTYTLAKYFQEIGLLQYEICHDRPSRIAAAAMYLALWLLKRDEVCTIALVHYSQYHARDLKEMAQNIAVALINHRYSHFQALFKKYSSRKLMKVSQLPEVSPTAMKKSIELFKMQH